MKPGELLGEKKTRVKEFCDTVPLNRSPFLSGMEKLDFPHRYDVLEEDWHLNPAQQVIAHHNLHVTGPK
jgi:hypothetical protein